jgi:hypothetical protein
VAEPTEYGAAKADMQRVKDTLAAHRADLRALGSERAAALDASVASLDRLVAERADPAEVQRRADGARRALSAMFGR